MKGAVFAALLVGCSFSGPAGQGAPNDASIEPDAAIDAGSMCADFVPSKIDDIDSLPVSSARPQLTAAGVYTYDTTDSTFLDPDGAPIDHDTAVVGGARVLVLRALLIGSAATLEVTGDLPLYIVATERIDIAGVVDAGSTMGRAGPGAENASCAMLPESGDEGRGGGGGGGGGGFGGAGGTGGAGDGGARPGGPGGGTESAPAIIRAGCPGAAGGGGGLPTAPGGEGGLGGGGIELAACEIAMAGTITAGGAGGGGGNVVLTGLVGVSGGGGGGSGGYIGIEAAVFTAGSSTVLSANGGGGGEGADDNQSGMAGDPGGPGAGPAPGGTAGADQGADGGAGSGASSLPGQAPLEQLGGGGGGGGGGAGYILIEAGATDGTAGLISPPAQPMP